MSGRILAGVLAVLLMMVAGAAEPSRVVQAEETGYTTYSGYVGAAEPTRVVQAEEILKKIELGQPVEYDNVIVEGDLDLSGLDLPRKMVGRLRIEELLGLPNYEVIVSPPISISNSVIRGSVNLKGAIFQKEVDFLSTIFEGPAFLESSRFIQTVYLNRAQFNQDVHFREAQFNQTAWFWESRFNQTADFGGTRFNQDALFGMAQFNQTAYLSGAQFNQIADFRKAQFNQTAYIWSAQFNQTADFEEAQFNQESHFEDAHFLNLFFNNSQFLKEAFFVGTQINGTLSLYRTKYDTLNIRWSSINDLAYDDTAYHLLIQNFNKLGFSDDASECQYSYR